MEPAASGTNAGSRLDTDIFAYRVFEFLHARAARPTRFYVQPAKRRGRLRRLAIEQLQQSFVLECDHS